jgi:hypothetical protein|tara:strand:- start:369 stop:821 length:453 start_codon:yes stop_codon:yes gene_type:complete
MNFNPFYKKPKPSTMKANREIARKHFKKELKWLKDNIDRLTKNKHKFLIEMYMILVTGNRRFTDKMLSATRKSIKKCMNNPNYNVLMKTEADEKIRPILSKINIVLIQAESKGHRGIGFIESIKDYVLKNYRITQKQMTALNKIYKELNG